MTTVREIMSTHLVTVEPTMTLMEAAVVMATSEVGSTLVLHEERIVGIFTERDILRALAHHRVADEARVAGVERWMTPDPVTIDPDATLGEALDLMLSGGFRHLPVMDDDLLVGVISMRDLAQRTAKTP
ncbi:MAG: CBS domain-containing protein [Actinomycetota bacterium]